MVLIPAGEFLMGSPDADKDAEADEKPQHRVRITKPFYLGKYLVTQEQWEAVMGDNPSGFKGPKNPVEQRQLGRLPEVSGQAEREVGRGGGQVPVAHRGAVGICLPGGEHDAILLWGRRVAAGRICVVWRRTRDGTDASGGREEAERLGAVRHARERMGVVCQDWYDARVLREVAGGRSARAGHAARPA